MPSTEAAHQDISTLVERLIRQARANTFDPFRDLTWPDAVGTDALWMSPELMTVHGTSLAETLTDGQRHRLGKHESLNFYSLNVHGIRELLVEVSRRIHKPGFEHVSEFFHQFIAEENEHMWYFARFCLQYGSRLYPERTIRFPDEHDANVATFLVFARILIFEEIVDFFNVRMAEDDALDPFVRQINRLHHEDEARHIAFGRHVVRSLHEELRRVLSTEALGQIEQYLWRYIDASVNSLYNPLAYRDAGIPDPYAFRLRVLAEPARAAFHDQWLKRTVEFLGKHRILGARPAISQSASEAQYGSECQ